MMIGIQRYIDPEAYVPPAELTSRNYSALGIRSNGLNNFLLDAASLYWLRHQSTTLQEIDRIRDNFRPLAPTNIFVLMLLLFLMYELSV